MGHWREGTAVFDDGLWAVNMGWFDWLIGQRRVSVTNDEGPPPYVPLATAYGTLSGVAPASRYRNDGEPGWELNLHTHLGDDQAPHRPLIEKLSDAYREFAITLPTWERYEDFVEGVAHVDGHDVDIYYETTFSYLNFWCAERAALDRLRSALLTL